jgi:hypothetical protein
LKGSLKEGRIIYNYFVEGIFKEGRIMIYNYFVEGIFQRRKNNDI